MLLVCQQLREQPRIQGVLIHDLGIDPLPDGLDVVDDQPRAPSRYIGHLGAHGPLFNDFLEPFPAILERLHSVLYASNASRQYALAHIVAVGLDPCRKLGSECPLPQARTGDPCIPGDLFVGELVLGHLESSALFSRSPELANFC